jgi:hypothetical protein
MDARVTLMESTIASVKGRTFRSVELIKERSCHIEGTAESHYNAVADYLNLSE